MGDAFVAINTGLLFLDAHFVHFLGLCALCGKIHRVHAGDSYGKVAAAKWMGGST